MKTAPIMPARLRFEADGPPTSLDYHDTYHPRAGAFVNARHVFLGGNGLPARWQGRDRFVVLETGFGLGNNFLATWQAWRDDPQRSRQLVFVSVERHPLTREDLQRVHAATPAPALASQLVAAWPPLTPNLHRLVFGGGRVVLLLALGDAVAWLPELTAQVDAFYLDGFAPDLNPELWQPRLLKALGRLAAPGATLASGTAASTVRDGLASAGFVVRKSAGMGNQGDITLADFAPSFVPKRLPARRALPATGEHHALVVGAGLAGCATVAALAEQGWRSTLVDRHTEPAQEASGNPAGLFHGVVHAQDGAHARFNRAAALEAGRAIRERLPMAAVDQPLGEVNGLLRLETALPDAEAMRAVLAELGLPPDHVQALSAADAGARAGVPLNRPAWFYPGGGWVRPAALANAWLTEAGDRCRFVGGVNVERLRQDGDSWQLLDAQGVVIAAAPVLVLANAGDALRLLAGLRGSSAMAGDADNLVGALSCVRGQLSWLPAAAVAGWRLPEVPLVGAGYLLPAVDGQAVFGATSQPGDADPAVRPADQQHNLDRLAQLIPALADLAASLPPAQLQGRTGWRWVARDRLPVIGAVPLACVQSVQGTRVNGLPKRPGGRLDQPRFVPRQPGLFLFSALGSRGIAWASLGAQVLAASVTGAPVPLEASLLDAVDPARFLTRALRRWAAEQAAQ